VAAPLITLSFSQVLLTSNYNCHNVCLLVTQGLNMATSHKYIEVVQK